MANAQTTPLALSAHVEALGKGSDGTVVGAVLQIAPEDRERAGERVRVVTTLRIDDDIIDRQSGVVVLQPDGTAMLYREWDPGTYMLEIAVANLNGTASGIWLGEIEVAEYDEQGETPLAVFIWDSDWYSVLISNEGKGKELLDHVGSVASVTGTITELDDDGEFKHAMKVSSYTIEEPADLEDFPEDEPDEWGPEEER